MASSVTREEIFSLLQNQAELMGLLREPIKNEKDLLKAKDDLSKHNDFINQIGRISTRLQLPVEIVFQCLMHMSTFVFDHAGASASKGNGAPADFDRQHRHGNVPMHQAKVLKREGLSEIQPKLEAAVPPEKLKDMIHFSSSLRSLVRMKVEDGNDLARKAISYADDYMHRIFNLSKGNSQMMWKMFNAVDDRELLSLISLSNGGSGNENLASSVSSSSLDATTNNNTFGTLGGTISNFQGTLSPLPPSNQMMNAIDSLCKKSLVSATTPVAERQGALANLEHWFRSLSVVKDDDEDEDYDDDYDDDEEEEEQFDNDDNHEDSAVMMKSKGRRSGTSNNNSNNKRSFTPDLLRAIFASVSFRKGIAVHVGEKRSALCRTACDIVSILLQNISTLNLVGIGNMMSEFRESLVAWLEVLLKQVHITVAAIATATDGCVRDMFVATGGHISLMNMTAQVASAASQPELQRKCIGYLALGVVSHLHTFDVSEVDPAAKCSVIATAAAKLLKSSSEAVRRAARVAGTVSQRVYPSIGIQGWDERVEKAASAEAYLIASAAEAGTLEFECSALKYPEPCQVSQHCPNKYDDCGISLAGNNNQSSFNQQHSTTSSTTSVLSSSSSSQQHQQQHLMMNNNNNFLHPVASNSSMSSVASTSTNSTTTTGMKSSSSTTRLPTGGGGGPSRLDSLALPKNAQQQRGTTTSNTRIPLSTSSSSFVNNNNNNITRSNNIIPSSGNNVVPTKNQVHLLVFLLLLLLLHLHLILLNNVEIFLLQILVITIVITIIMSFLLQKHLLYNNNNNNNNNK